MYVIPPQILPCDQISLPDLRYINAEYAPVKHPFKAAFGIESYNIMWLDKTMILKQPSLQSICKYSIPPPIEDPITSSAVNESTSTSGLQLQVIPSIPDTIEEMGATLTDKDNISNPLSTVVIEKSNSVPSIASPSDFLLKVIASTDNICFVACRGADMLRPKWYIVQIDLDDNNKCSGGKYFVDFLQCHPTDAHKSQDLARWWLDWYEIEWTDKTETSFDYGRLVLVRPDRKPRTKKNYHYSDTLNLSDSNILLLGPFDFLPKVHGCPAKQLIGTEHWSALAGLTL